MKMSRWQPMKTAPMDGTPVYVVYKGNVLEARFGKADYFGEYDRKPHWFAYNIDEQAWSTCLCDDDDEPLGWMPLPGRSLPKEAS